MTSNIIYSIIESPNHPNFLALYERLDYRHMGFNSHRKVIHSLKKYKPAFIVAEFFYGYGNNYAGANLSNLDVLLSSLQKYSPATQVIVMVNKSQLQYAEQLAELFPLHGILVQPVEQQQIEELLNHHDR